MGTETAQLKLAATAVAGAMSLLTAGKITADECREVMRDARADCEEAGIDFEVVKATAIGAIQRAGGE